MKYAKLFDGIVNSTVWGESHSTRIVWVTLLAMADRDGYVGGSVPGLAHLARVTLEEAEQALARFLAPDEYSRTSDYEGRRIVAMDGGWVVLNYVKYCSMHDDEARRAQVRDAMRRYRAKKSKDVEATVITNDHIDHSDHLLSPVSVDVDVDVKSKVKSKSTVASRPTPARMKCPLPGSFGISERVEVWAKAKGFDRVPEHLESFKLKCAANGYEKIDWDAAFMEAIREDWAKLRGGARGVAPPATKTLTQLWDERKVAI